MSQDFSPKTLRNCCRESELTYYPEKENDIKLIFDYYCKRMLKEDFIFSLNKKENYFEAGDFFEKIILRKLNENIRNAYKVKQSNRNVIIDQISKLLDENVPFFVLRTDIKSFFESINTNFLLRKFQDDFILSYQSIYLLKKLLTDSAPVDHQGLPRGISVSSTLSELYMKNFDRYLKNLEGVYYYNRFVDDIIVFSTSSHEIYLIKKELKNYLKENLGLHVNDTKTKVYKDQELSSKPLEYLGYEFSLPTKRNLHINISYSKIKKFKSRIVYSFLSYIKTLDFPLLKKRMQFLTGNYPLTNYKEGQNLKTGIYYNYSLINDYSNLEELNMFYKKLLYSKKGSLGNKINNTLTKGQKKS